MKKLAAFVLGLTIAGMANADPISFDLNVHDGFSGSGQITFLSHDGFDVSNVSAFSFTVNAQSGNLAPLPITFELSDLDFVTWSASSNSFGAYSLDNLSLSTVTLSDSGSVYDLLLKIGKRKTTPSVDCSTSKIASKVTTPDFGIFCSAAKKSDIDNTSVALLVASHVQVPEPPALVLLVTGLAIIRLVSGRLMRRRRNRTGTIPRLA